MFTIQQIDDLNARSAPVVGVVVSGLAYVGMMM